MKFAMLLGLCAVLLAAGVTAYAQVVVLGEPDSDPTTIVYSGSQGTQTAYQRGYNDGFDDGYSTGYVRGAEHGRNTPYNRYYHDCDDIDDFDDFEDCYGYAYPAVYPVYPVVPYRYSQYSYAAPPCRSYGYSRYC